MRWPAAAAHGHPLGPILPPARVNPPHPVRARSRRQPSAGSGTIWSDRTTVGNGPARGFLTAPPESWLWGERHETARAALGFPGEMTLLPGVVLVGLGVAGLFFSAWRVRHRVALAAGVLVSVALAAGTTLGGDGDPGYVTLVRHAPGWDGIRTPGRLVLWTTLLLGLLAAGALTVAEPETRSGGWRRCGRWLLVFPVALVLVEGINRTPHVPAPVLPAALRGVDGPLLVLPSGIVYHLD